MAIAITPGEITKVFLPCDKDLPDHEKSWFHLATVNYKVQQRLLKHTAVLKKAEKAAKRAEEAELDEDDMVEITIDENFLKETLGELGRPVGLVGWENFNNAKGQEIKFDKKNFLNWFSLTDLFHLAGEVYKAQFLSEQDEKN